MTDKNETLPEWEVVYTIRTRVHARAPIDALDEARPRLQSRYQLDLTDVRVYCYDALHQLAGMAEVIPTRRERSKNSPIEILREKAREQCTWCWHEFWCAKDPREGWVHIDKGEYQARGKPAVHRCEAQELSEQMFELEEAERLSDSLGEIPQRG